MNRRTAPVVLLALVALSLPAQAKSTRKPAPPPVVEAPAPPPGPVDPGKRPFPAALPERPFTMPSVQRATLSNGLEVMVVENHEVPLFEASLVLDVAGWADPKKKEGLASVTFDMMNEGAAGKSAADLGRALKKLGGGVSAGAGTDSASVGASGPVANLAGIVGVMADVLLHPDFPAAEWDLMRTKRIADLKASMEDPSAIAGRVAARLAWGDAYRGRLDSEAAYTRITTKDLKRFHGLAVRPDHAVLLVGGDVELAEVVPVLEAALGGWRAKGRAPKPSVPVALPKTDVVYLVDKPGAAQSVLAAGAPVNDRRAPDYYELFLANTALGVFTGRLNMNLREDKGWSYGARCGLDDSLGASLWSCSTSVQADKTGPALAEMRKEIAGPTSGRPFTDDEIGYFRGYRVNAWASRYELPGALLGGLAQIWRYDLPADWIERYVPALEAVDTTKANASFARWVHPDRVGYLVVGDAAKVRPQIEAAVPGVKIVALDRDGNPTDGAEGK